MSLEGKVAIVTGAGRGIGRAEALCLAAEGCRVVVNDAGTGVDGSGQSGLPAQDVVEAVARSGGVAIANAGDVADWDESRKIFDEALDLWGRVDILVNNAGVLRDRMSFNMSEDDWDTVVRVHLKGHFVMAHHAVSHWRDQAKAGNPGGRIVNTSSEAGLYGLAGQANYVAAKAGIAALTVTLAREANRYGVTANAIAPRARTRMSEGILGDAIAPREGAPDPWDPAVVAPVVAWLCSDAAAHVNGQVFVVGGGCLALMRGWDAAGLVPMEEPWLPDRIGREVQGLFAASGTRADVNTPPASPT